MTNNKLSDKEINEMFKNGQLIARTFETDLPTSPEGIKYNLHDLDFEMTKLNSKSEYDRNWGQRNRSATLLVPDIEMDLFQDVGFLYNADESTIRGYMFYDSATTSQQGHENYYNINEDKKKFEPILSRKEFIKKYKEYRNRTDGIIPYEQHRKYNEVLGNFFPESLVGIVCKNNTPENKLLSLAVKQRAAEKYGVDLPMTILNNGKIETWNPDLTEVSQLLNYSKLNIDRLSVFYPNKPKEQVLKNYAKELGFSLKVSDFNKDITPNDLDNINRYEYTAKEVINFIHKITNIPEGGKFSLGIEGRLKEVVNNRLESQGEKKIKNLNNVTITKHHLEDLVSMLDQEMYATSKTHKVMSKKEIDELSKNIGQEIHKDRLTEAIKSKNELDKIKTKLSRNINIHIIKITEFFNKVASLFQEKVITKKINKHQINRNT